MRPLVTLTRVWRATNTYDGATPVHSRELIDAALTRQNALRRQSDHRRLARPEKNRRAGTASLNYVHREPTKGPGPLFIWVPRALEVPLADLLKHLQALRS